MLERVFLDSQIGFQTAIQVVQGRALALRVHIALLESADALLLVLFLRDGLFQVALVLLAELLAHHQIFAHVEVFVFALARLLLHFLQLDLQLRIFVTRLG